MRYILTIIAISTTLLFFSCYSKNEETNLSPAQFENKIKEMPSAPLIDVRTPDEFSKGHLPNAQNFDWNGDDFDKQVTALDKSKPVFVYCLSGGRSSSAAAKMRNDGFKKVYELDGGIMKWRSGNLPETTDNQTKSTGMTLQEFNKLLESDKPVLVDFYAEWCAPCKKMKPHLDEITTEMSEKVTIIRIDADSNSELCNALKIESLPVLQLYKKTKLSWTNLGYIEKEDIVKQLN
jgi:thioredoxin